MFRAVIRQIIHDCQRSFDKLTFYNYKEYKPEEREPIASFEQILDKERRYILRDLKHEWVKEICFYAGVDPPKLFRKCYNILAGKDEYRYHRVKSKVGIKEKNQAAAGKAGGGKRGV